MSTLWQGRMEAQPEDIMLAFTASLSFDVQLADADIIGSKAHIAGLQKAGIISTEEHKALHSALSQVAEELEGETFEFQATDEDIHTAIERRVTEIAGETGAKLHTGRSRNDQVATAFRLWSREKLIGIQGQIFALQETLAKRAEEVGTATIPGYTHLQRAQPIYLADHLLAHGWALSRDTDRIDDALKRMDVSPLGAGALAGSTLNLDPAFTAKEMGFSTHFENSLDAVSDRDFVAEALFVLALLGVHLSRIGEEIIFWSSKEVGFLELPEGWSTGSSMLPQKKNPDIAELVRAKSGRLIGNLTGLLAVLKGLPLAYNRDLQEDKEPLFDSTKQIQLGLAALSGLLSTCVFETEVMEAATKDPELAATALAEYLVGGGVPFREAHGKVGKLVRRQEVENRDLKELVKEELGETAARLIPAQPPGDPKASLKKFKAHLSKAGHKP